MIRLSSIIERFEAEYLAGYAGSISPDQRQALTAMKTCRTSASPLMQAQCTECDHAIRVPHSCGHRSCPHCQHHESQQWLERQRQKQVPATYFLLTFTLPDALRPLARAHPRTVYDLMSRCSWETVKTFTHNDPQLQGQAGAISVVHTHSRRLDYHPHVHLVVPAAAVDAQRQRWRTRGRNNATYLFNHKALATVFRAKLLDALTQQGLALPPRYPSSWVVDCKCVGAGEKALVYLGRYLYRGVIQEKDIIACQDGQVTFRYRHGKTRRLHHRTLPGAEFLALILQHVLPKGFRRARNFGFLHPNSKRLIVLIQLLLRLKSNPTAWRKPRPQLRCACCGGQMIIVRTRIPPTEQPLRPVPNLHHAQATPM